jgi:hypothetical protein
MSRKALLQSMLVLAIAPAIAANAPAVQRQGFPSDRAIPAGVGVLAPVPVQTFSGNSGERYYSIGVANTGTLTSFESPLGVSLIGTRVYEEGYALHYDDPLGEWDFYSRAHWGPSIVSDLSPLTIVRTTEDGRMQLTQQFKADKAEIDFTITMTLKNISGEALSNVHLCRFADVPGLKGDYEENWGSTNEYSAYNIKNQGLLLEGMTVVEPARTERTYLMWEAGYYGNCVEGWFPNMGPTDYAQSVHVVYKLNTMKSGESQTLKFRYRRL